MNVQANFSDGYLKDSSENCRFVWRNIFRFLSFTDCVLRILEDLVYEQMKPYSKIIVVPYDIKPPIAGVTNQNAC